VLPTLILLFVLILCLTYTYTNGFQDGSSVTATAIGSRALSPVQAICLVAVFEFLGALLGGSGVAASIGALSSWPDTPSLLPVLSSGLLAAVSWNFITRQLRLPSSSTHALVGGVLGGLYAGSGSFKYVVWGDLNSIYNATGFCKVALSLFVSPVLGIMAGYLVLTIAYLVLRKATTRANTTIKRLQWLTTAVMAFGHGANDTQKAMGVMMLALGAMGFNPEHTVPLWVRLLTGVAMSLGVASMVPGIVRKVGSGIYRLRPLHGLATQIGSAFILITASATGGPVSATQVISSTVMGVGTADRLRGVHWLVAKDMLLAWFLTIPCSGLLAAMLHLSLCHWLNSLL